MLASEAISSVYPIVLLAAEFRRVHTSNEDETKELSVFRSPIFKRLFFCTTVAALLSPVSSYAEDTSDPYSNGGAIGARGIVARYNKSGQPMRIRGACRSSCTQLLAIKNACVEPSATLYFHAPILNPNQSVNPATRADMASFYKPALRNYLLSNHYMDGWEFHAISGSELIHKYGYRECR